MISLKGINKSYNSKSGENIEIYKELDIHIDSGEFISIMGPSGSGKTTFLNLVSGLDVAESGEILVNKVKLNDLSEEEKTDFRGKNISFIFQDFNLIENLSVEENIDLIIDINKLERRYETSEIIKKVGLEWREKEYPYNLSGGERQRVSVARAFVGVTPILLADEPTGNLDMKNSENVMALLEKLHKETWNTIVIITHDDEIAKLTEKTYMLDGHKLKI